MSTVYGDFHKQKSNPDLCTNAIGVPVQGQVMLDLLWSRFSIKNAPPLALTSSPFPFDSLILREI